MNAAMGRRDDAYRALPSGDTFRRPCIRRDWRPPLPLLPPSVPPLPSRARLVSSSVVGERGFDGDELYIIDGRRRPLEARDTRCRDAALRRSGRESYYKTYPTIPYWSN